MKWRWRRKTVIDALSIASVAYSAGLFLGIMFLILRFLRRIKVVCSERLPHWQKNMIIVSNHPSLIETILLPNLFLGEYLCCPWQFLPVSTPDKKNFYDPWWFFWLRPVSIPIDRENGSSREPLKAMLELLKSGKRLVLFAEGGRTFKGKEFVFSPQKRQMRQLVNGAGLLAAKAGSMVLPIWVEGATHKSFNNFFLLLGLWGFWRYRITIKIGQSFFVDQDLGVKDATRQIQNELLKLADEE